jgi:response regulator RpfG family c-di-GMP phosphodiesterase
MQTRILLIDDDTNLLQTMQRSLRKDFEVHTATSGQQGLDLLRQQGPFAVLVSDLKMPQMDGIEVLRLARKISPETVRILLTGYTDQETAIKATNTGKVFRFLTKPCETQTLMTTLQEATLHYRMLQAKQDLIEETLVGAVGLLSQILGQVNPEALATTNRLKRYSLHIARESEYQELWLVEMAAMLSHIGCLSIPPAVLHTYNTGNTLSPEEAAMLAAHPGEALALLRQISGFEEVSKIIMLAHGTMTEVSPLPLAVSEKETRTTLGGRILQTAMILDNHLMAGLSAQQALEQMVHDDRLDQKLVAACRSYPLNL